MRLNTQVYDAIPASMPSKNRGKVLRTGTNKSQLVLFADFRRLSSAAVAPKFVFGEPVHPDLDPAKVRLATNRERHREAPCQT